MQPLAIIIIIITSYSKKNVYNKTEMNEVVKQNLASSFLSTKKVAKSNKPPTPGLPVPDAHLDMILFCIRFHFGAYYY